MIGCEPTGHYWYTFYQFVKIMGWNWHSWILHLESSELDDNSPKKQIWKIKDDCKACNRWRYGFPYMCWKESAEIREVTLSRDRIMKELRMQHPTGYRDGWRYIFRISTVYKKFDTTTGMMILEEVPLPTMVTALGVDNIIKIYGENIKCVAKAPVLIGQRPGRCCAW